ncbi:MAG: hypothetical protein Q7R51_00255 [bacterium]|nr:hypothetical protein [bacterium]
MAISKEAREMFHGFKPSREALNVVEKACSLGMNPTSIVEDAIKKALRRGRNKAGMFGEQGKPFRDLREVVENAQRAKTIFQKPRER